MKIKYSQIKEAMDYLRNKGSLSDVPNHEINFSIREEDPGAGVIGECLILSTVVTKKPASYDDYKSDIVIEYTMEIFASHENRQPRVVAVETRELEKKA